MNKILIADDEANILTLLQIMLEDMNVTVITAENGESAVEKARRHKPDLVITDVVMPKMNGFEVCQHIRNIDDISDIPIILLSALGDDYNKLSGFEEGANDYITKPFNIEELKNRTETLLYRHLAKKTHVHTKEKNPHPEKVSIGFSSEATKQTPPLQATIKTDITQHKQDITIKKPSTISTGFKELDKNLHGGLPIGSNILICGEIGSGKSSIARNIAKESLLTRHATLN